jgi:hypothetical protein
MAYLVTLLVDEHYVRTTTVEIKVHSVTDTDFVLDDLVDTVEAARKDGTLWTNPPPQWHVRRGQLNDTEQEVYLDGYEEL